MTTVAASTALVTTTPVWTALAARLSGRPAAAAVWGGLVLAVVGVALIAGVDVTVSLRALAGDGLALLGAVAAAATCSPGRGPGGGSDVGLRGHRLLHLRARRWPSRRWSRGCRWPGSARATGC